MSNAPALLAQAVALLAPASPLALRAAFGWFCNYATPARDLDLAPRCDEHGVAREVLSPSAELRVIVSVPTGPSAKYSAPLRVELVDILGDGDAARYSPVDLDGLDALAARLASPIGARWGLKVSPRTFKRLDLARYATLEGDCAWFHFDRDAAAYVLHGLGSGGLAVRCARADYQPGGPSRAALDQAEFEARFNQRMRLVDEYEARFKAPAPAEVVVEVVEVVEAPAEVVVEVVEAPAPAEVVEVEAPAPAGWRWFNVSAEAAPALLACGYPSARGAACLPVSSLRSLAARLRALARAYPGALELAARIEGAARR
jgi:acyl dehydratase